MQQDHAAPSHPPEASGASQSGAALAGAQPPASAPAPATAPAATVPVADVGASQANTIEVSSTSAPAVAAVVTPAAVAHALPAPAIPEAPPSLDPSHPSHPPSLDPSHPSHPSHADKVEPPVHRQPAPLSPPHQQPSSPESPYVLPSGLLAAGLAAQAKYSAAFGSKSYHEVPPLDPARSGVTLDGGLPGYARPTHSMPYPATMGSFRYGDAATVAEVEADAVAASYGGGMGATPRGGHGRGPSCLSRPPREPYRQKQAEHVGVAHARIQFEDGQQGAEPPQRGRRVPAGGSLAGNPSAGGGGAGAVAHKRVAHASKPRYALSAAASVAASARKSGGHASTPAGAVPPQSARGRAAAGAHKGRPAGGQPAGAGEGFAAETQVGAVIKAIEEELKDLNGQYTRALQDLKGPEHAEGSQEKVRVHARLRALVIAMEQKGAQLNALRRTHAVLADDKLLTRGALEHAVASADRLRHFGSPSQRQVLS